MSSTNQIDETYTGTHPSTPKLDDSASRDLVPSVEDERRGEEELGKMAEIPDGDTEQDSGGDFSKAELQDPLVPGEEYREDTLTSGEELDTYQEDPRLGKPQEETGSHKEREGKDIGESSEEMDSESQRRGEQTPGVDGEEELVKGKENVGDGDSDLQGEGRPGEGHGDDEEGENIAQGEGHGEGEEIREGDRTVQGEGQEESNRLLQSQGEDRGVLQCEGEGDGVQQGQGEDGWVLQGQGEGGGVPQGQGDEPEEEDQGVYSDSEIGSETTSYPGESRASVKEAEVESKTEEEELDLEGVRKKRSESRIQFKDIDSPAREVTNVSRAKVNSPVSHTTEDKHQLENRLLESRERTYEQAMNLMSARCTSVQTFPPYGPNSPEYFYIHQQKPSPMPPLKAWRGYHGNVYFEPITITGIKEDRNKMDATSQSRRRSVSRNTVAIRCSPRRPVTHQLVVLDRNVVMNRFGEHQYEDLVWLEGQDSVGSLSLRPQTYGGRRHFSSSHFDRIRKGCVSRGIQQVKREQRHLDIKVKGDKFLQPSVMSPLLLSTTQYSHSNQRAVMSSPDPYHHHHGYHDHFLPPVEQVRVSLRHVDNSREAFSRSSPYSRSANMTGGFKPFVRYSPEVKAKYGRKLLTM